MPWYTRITVIIETGAPVEPGTEARMVSLLTLSKPLTLRDGASRLLRMRGGSKREP